MELKPHLNHIHMSAFWVLIVPYGIETTKAYRDRMMTEVLIVPYGIETGYKQQKAFHPLGFNRTLWN